MNSNANAGTEPPASFSPASAGGAETRERQVSSGDTGSGATNDPAAEALLRRYLSEVHGFRHVGNSALRELEERLTTLTRGHAPHKGHPQPAQTATAPRTSSMRGMPAPQRTAPREDRTLNDRLRDLTSHLHEDLAKGENVKAAAPRRPETAAPRQTTSVPRAVIHKPAPSAPIFDRAWFEERFASMRTSINEIAESVPVKRLEALEQQFRELMERLEVRDSVRGGAGQVETSLKRLAVYLEDSKQWSVSHDKRMRGVEDKLNDLSGLVAQSHAAISATAKGLEIIAKGTGPKLARATADLVVGQLEGKIAALNSARPIEDLNREVVSLAMQSRQQARSTEERLKQLQTSFSDSLKRHAAQSKVGPVAAAGAGAKDDADMDDFEELDAYDDELSNAVQRAARLSDREADQSKQGEPLRYQIPYGEFLPDDERRPSHLGLIVAAVILLLASAAMLYLNLRDKKIFSFVPSANVSQTAAPAVTGGASEATGGETVLPKRTVQSTATGQQGSASTADAQPKAPAGIVLANSEPVAAQQKAAPGSLMSAETAASSPSDAKDRRTSAGDAEKGGSVREAAVNGDLDAQFHVGQSYLTGRDADQQVDPQERFSRAVRWFRRAAESGHVPSQYRLATLYELGQGAPKDIAEARKWYRSAAEGGHVKAMHNLAVLSILTQGEPADYQTAVKWFTQAAERGLTDSQYNLALLYERGLGVPQDAVKAFKWFALAAKHGDEKATQRRDTLARTLSPVQQAEATQLIDRWNSLPVNTAANGKAPEPPANDAQPIIVAVKPEEPRAHVMKTAWTTTTISSRNSAIADVQRLLARLGHDVGPIDGIIGPRTMAAISEFELQNGLPVDGQVSVTLTAKLATVLK